MTAQEWFNLHPIVEVCPNFLKLGISEKAFKPKRTRMRGKKSNEQKTK